MTDNRSQDLPLRCLNCHGPLTTQPDSRLCAVCDRRYPVVSGITILVKEPADYLRQERDRLVHGLSDTKCRREVLERDPPFAGLPAASLNRHRDVLDVETAQAEMLLSLLEHPAASIPDVGDDLYMGRAGWSFDTLVPYLLRDWTGTPELAIVSSRINAALKHAFPDPRDKTVAFAGCGAGGLLAGISTDFTTLVGFDLTLPMLAAARQLLDGNPLHLALPRALNDSGGITLARRAPRSANSRVELFAMDALDTAFADQSVDCVVTMFLTDILPDPQLLADEVHRILSGNGVWINYGPSGNNMKALWRFDDHETPAFFESGGFAVVRADAQRATSLDITGSCPPASFRNVMCYLTLARKTGKPERRSVQSAFPPDLRNTVPQHCPGAQLVHRLQIAGKNSVLLEHERIPGRVEKWNLSERALRMIMLVNGKRTVGEIADLLMRKTPSQTVEETCRVFTRLFKDGLLTWQ